MMYILYYYIMMNITEQLLYDIKSRLQKSGTSSSPTTIINQGANQNNIYSRYRNTNLINTPIVVKSSAGNIYGLNIINESGFQSHIKFYNTTNVTVGSTIPVHVLYVPNNTSIQITPDIVPYEMFDTAITVAATRDLPDNDNTFILPAESGGVYLEIKYI